MWERLRSWVGRGRDAEAPEPVDPPRWRPAEVPALLRAVLSDPAARERRAVYADWLIEQGEPLGEVINRELAEGASWGVLRGYASHLPDVLGDLAPVLHATRFELGLPVAGFVHGGRPDLLAHPQWAAVRHIQTGDPAVAGALARIVPSLHVLGNAAIEAVAAARPGVVRTLRLDLDTVPAHLPPIRVPSVVLTGPEPLRPAIALLLEQPIRELRAHTRTPPDTDLLRRFGAHPTLERVVWRTGQWGRPGPVSPLVAPWARPEGLPARLVPVQHVSDGVDRRFWLAHDRTSSDAVVVAIRDRGASAPDGTPIERPLATFGQDPVIELYRPTLEPLPPRPWAPELAGALGALYSALQVSVEGFDPVSTSQMFVVRGTPVAVAPVQRSRARRLSWSQPSGVPRWGFAISRCRAKRVEAGVWTAEPGVFALLHGESNFRESGGLQHRIAQFIDDCDARDVDALVGAASRFPWQPYGTASMVAVDRPGGRVAWIGDCGALVLEGPGRMLTRAHNLDGGWEEPDATGVPALLQLLGSPGGQPTFEWAPLEGRSRLLIANAALFDRLDGAVLVGLAGEGEPTEAVQAVVSAYREAGGVRGVAVLLIA